MSILALKHILIITDDANLFSEVATLLEQQLATVRTQSYKTFMVAGAPPKTALIILDHCSPDGICSQLLGQLTKDPKFSTTPIVAVVEPGSSTNVEEVIAQGASDYFLRNESSEGIVDKIKSLLGAPGDYYAPADIDISEYESNAEPSTLRVFVVEDDPLLRNLLGHKFLQHNIPVQFSPDGKGAIEQMRQFSPNVVILDLMLPGYSGFDLLADMQQDSQLAAIPVVVFSNRDSAEDRARATELGAKKFYVKAVTSLSELVQILIEVTNPHSSPSS